MARTIDSPSDLLFGLMALEVGLIDQDHLASAYVAWTSHSGKSLAEILIERGDLDEAGRSELAAKADRRWGKPTVHSDLTQGMTVVGLSLGETRVSLQETLAETADHSDPTVTMAWEGGGTLPSDDQDEEWVGTRTSEGKRFRILRPHAEGGLGLVSVALDDELNREVALKQILPHHADKVVSRARFLLEAQITGSLEHPGIVPIYGLGHDEKGRPFYAMRFIKGDSLKEAIAKFHNDPVLKADHGKRSLALRKLLRRFIDVCNAIDFAHGRGVIHRDIKPANVIVGTHGETLVVDWGIAKVIGKPDLVKEDGESATTQKSSTNSAETLPGSTLGTPGFMSPEQAVGDLEHVGPASDVYSLGATLYALLTGQQPFHGKDIPALLLRIKNGSFRPPSELDPTIDRALEVVCLKAMTLKPEDRYHSARTLAEDIERWMADEPVSAWVEPFSRRSRRWARRNRSLVTAAAAGLIAGVIGLAGILAVETSANAEIAELLRRQTEANAELTRSKGDVQRRYNLAVDAIKTFHTGVSEDFLLKQDQFKELRDRLLKSAADFYQRLGAILDREADPESRRALASANFEVAELTRKVGRSEDALKAHRQVLEAREAMANERDSSILVKVDISRSLIAIAGLLHETGDTAGGVKTYRRSEALLTSLPGGMRAARSALAACRMRLGTILSRIGENTEALRQLRLARSEQAELAADASSPVESRADLSIATSSLGHVLKLTGDLRGAEDQYRQALAIIDRLVAGDLTSTDFRFRQGVCHTDLGQLLSETSRSDVAESEYGLAIGIFDRLARENPAVTDFRRNLAWTHNQLGWLLTLTSRRPAAEVEHGLALDIWNRLVEENQAVTGFRNSLATCHIYLGMLKQDTARSVEAETEYRAAIEIHERLVIENDSLTGFRNSLGNDRFTLASLLLEIGKLVDAEVEYRKAIAIQDRLVMENADVSEYQFRLASSREGLGALLARMGRMDDAEREFRAAIVTHQRLVETSFSYLDYRRRLARSRANLGIVLAEGSRLAEAEAEYREAMRIQEGLIADDPNLDSSKSYMAFIRSNLAKLLAETGRSTEAEAEFRAAIEVHAGLARKDSTDTEISAELATSRDGFGQLLSEVGRLADAEAEFRQAISGFKQLANANPVVHEFRQGLASSRTHLGLLLAETGRVALAEAEHRASIAGFEQLVAENPAIGRFRDGLADSLTNLGSLKWANGDPSEALKSFRRSLAILEPLVAANPKIRSPVDVLARTLTATGDASRRPNPSGDVRGLIERALAIREGLASGIPSVLAYRRDLAVVLGRVGLNRQGVDAAGAVAAYRRALAILATIPESRSTLFAEAGIRSLLSGLGDRPGSGLTVPQAEDEARAAVARFAKAIDAGWRDRDAIRQDPAFDPIRARDEFRLLMSDLAFPDRVFAP